MRVLITGASGFVGLHLAEVLYRNHTLHGTTRGEIQNDPRFASLHNIEIRDEHAVQTVIDATDPQVVVHLAAQAHVGTSFGAPWQTLEINIKGTLNVLQALRNRRGTRILLVSSAEVYGEISPSDLPIAESLPAVPSSPYSISKLTTEWLAKQSAIEYEQALIIVRPFNHIGPGQNPTFALPNFALQIAKMEAGLKEQVLHVGNLAAERDFTDVRDIVRAYEQLIVSGMPGTTYNLGSGRAVSIQTLVEMLIERAQCTVKVEVDPTRLRSLDTPRVIADISRVRDEVGWQPQIPLEQTIDDVLADARQVVRPAQ